LLAGLLGIRAAETSFFITSRTPMTEEIYYSGDALSFRKLLSHGRIPGCWGSGRRRALYV